MNKMPLADEFVKIKITHTLARVNRMPVPRGPELVVGKYVMFLEVSALKQTVYLPVSIASGRKSTGFIYHIEGTAEVQSKASISYEGDAAVIVTSGSISYCKIPAGATVTFKTFAEVEIAKSEKYRFVVSRVNYKLNPNDSRYKRLVTEAGTELLKFR